jgi:DNA-binding MarR family transcriptional regulator
MIEVECYCTHARRAAGQLTSFYDEALAPSGLRVTQFSLMRAVMRLGQPTISGLAEATGLDRSTLGRNLRVLQRLGLLRLGAGTDERPRVVSLSEAGEAVIDDAMPLWRRAQQRIEAVVGEESRAQLKRLADELQQL